MILATLNVYICPRIQKNDEKSCFGDSDILTYEISDGGHRKKFKNEKLPCLFQKVDFWRDLMEEITGLYFQLHTLRFFRK